MLESPLSPQGLASRGSSPLPPPPAKPSGDATRAFYAPTPQQPAAPAQQGPSEFTQMFKTPAKAAAPAPKPVKAPSKKPIRPKKKKQSNWIWWVVGAVVLVAIAVILFLALRS